jgi:hypothetical protein
MKEKIMERSRNERGVAMVTVLFVGAVLTTVASTAAFVTIREFHAGGDDRRAATALAYAEAGIDRAILEVRRGHWTWQQAVLSGCDAEHELLTVSGEIGNGTYAAELHPVECTTEVPNPREPQYVEILSTGEHPTAKRLVSQLVEIVALDLPVGVYAGAVDGNGTVGLTSASLITPGDVIGRDKIGFAGTDPYYTLADFYPGESDSTPIPAAAHAVGELRLSTGPPAQRIEHKSPRSNPECNANNGPSPSQSLWDGSKWGAPISTGCSGQTGHPPTTLFTEDDLKRVTPQPALSDQDYLTLAESAKSSGLYCTAASGNNYNCLRNGEQTTINGNVQPGDIAGVPGTFVAYFDFEPGSNKTVKWKASVEPCSSNPEENRSMVLIIRNGNLSMQSGSTVTGAILIPEGDYDSQGSFTVHGTIIAQTFWVRGSATITMSECWVQNMPGPFLDVTPAKWSEIDR